MMSETRFRLHRQMPLLIEVLQRVNDRLTKPVIVDERFSLETAERDEVKLSALLAPFQIPGY